MYLQANLSVIRNDKNITLTISGKRKQKNSPILEIIAYDNNSGNEVHLSLSEESAAYDLLSKWGKTKSQS